MLDKKYTVKDMDDAFDSGVEHGIAKRGYIGIQEYQERALATAIYKHPIIYPTLGLNGEAGEIAEKVKKVLRDKSGEFEDRDKVELAKEIGDVLWYCNALAHDLGFTLSQILEMNIDKLESRKNRGVIKGSGDNR